MNYYTMHTQLPPYIPYARFLLDFPLNETARLVYSLILSRIQLSQSNGWINKEGWVYCRYTVQDLMTDTGKRRSTIATALKDLEACGLLYRHRGGAGSANQLYLRCPENYTSDVRKTAHQTSGKLAPNKYKNKNINHIRNYAYTGDSL